MPKYDDHYFIGKAFEQARKSFREGGIPVGAVLAVPGREEILAAGHNRRNQDKDRTRHGEISCLADRKLDPIPASATLYTTLNPCNMCAGAILQFKIQRVVIGQNKVEDPKAAYFVGQATALEEQGIEVVILDDPDCEMLFAEFLSTPWGLESWLGDIGETS